MMSTRRRGRNIDFRSVLITYKSHLLFCCSQLIQDLWDYLGLDVSVTAPHASFITFWVQCSGQKVGCHVSQSNLIAVLPSFLFPQISPLRIANCGFFSLFCAFSTDFALFTQEKKSLICRIEFHNSSLSFQKKQPVGETSRTEFLLRGKNDFCSLFRFCLSFFPSFAIRYFFPLLGFLPSYSNFPFGVLLGIEQRRLARLSRNRSNTIARTTRPSFTRCTAISHTPQI